MPNAKVLSEKQAVVAALTEKLQNAAAGVIVDYKGITVADDTKLRKELQMRRTASSRRRIKAIGGRENRWMQDINHQVSKALATGNPKHTLFVLED